MAIFIFREDLLLRLLIQKRTDGRTLFGMPFDNPSGKLNMNFKKIPPFNGAVLNVIIETPKGSKNKYAYDTKLHVMKFKCVMPEGNSFPYDFGFIPNTKGEDGDPVDVLLLMDAPAFTGCLVECRVIGAILATQTDKKEKIRNDRILAVPISCDTYCDIKSLHDVNAHLLDQIVQFFVNYNLQKGKKFKPIKKIGPKEAIQLIKEKMEGVKG